MRKKKPGNRYQASSSEFHALVSLPGNSLCIFRTKGEKGKKEELTSLIMSIVN